MVIFHSFNAVLKISSYIAQYPIFRIAQNTFYFPPLQTCSIEYLLSFSGTLRC